MASAPHSNRRAWLVPALLVVVVLLPYLPMLTGAAMPIPDDGFASDLADGEMPGRFEASRLLANGESTSWTPRIEGGAQIGADPLSLVLFAWLPPAVALGWFLGFLLAIAALGTYGLARHLGASLAGAFLAGVAFAWSGFMVCQLRHLSIVATVAFVPLAVLCLDRAATGHASDAASAAALRWQDRAPWLVGFAGIYGLQILYGFLQSTYYASFLYGGVVLARAVWLIRGSATGLPIVKRIRPGAGLAGLSAIAVALSIAIGASALLALGDLAAISDRRGVASFEWATGLAYWPRNVLTFLFPYINGDISNATYVGKSIFWENFGYVGFATVVLALFAIALSWRRFATSFWFVATVLAFVIVLGSNTPVYRVLFDVVPGMDRFRFPTRMLFVVELGIVLLGGLGLTELERRIAAALRKRNLRPKLAPVLSAIIVVGTTANLIATNARQNPFADAERWFSTPKSARLILEQAEPGRVYTPLVRDRHVAVYTKARGWSGSLEPYFEHRESLQPNSNVLHGIPSLDGYLGIAPSWSVDLLGDHNRKGFLMSLVEVGPQGGKIYPALFDWLGALSVRWVLFPTRLAFPVLDHLGSAPPMEVYRLKSWMPRARMVERSRIFASHDALFNETVKGTFDISRELALHDPALALISARITAGAGETPGDATFIVDRSDEVVIETRATREAWLFLADTYYPGWVAFVDGHMAPIARANVAYRAVAVPPGTHRVTFRYQPPTLGRNVTIGASIVWALCGIAILYIRRSKRRRR